MHDYSGFYSSSVTGINTDVMKSGLVEWVTNAVGWFGYIEKSEEFVKRVKLKDLMKKKEPVRR